jgi:DNA repair protein RAD16
VASHNFLPCIYSFLCLTTLCTCCSGKTIQAIALILANRDNAHRLSSADSSINGSTPGGTLIVLPTVAITQWLTEIARFTKGGSLSVKVYHGSDRESSIEDLSQADIVLTSYKILEMEYRKATAELKVECSYCLKKYFPDKLRDHRKYFCGEGAERTEAQSKTQKRKKQNVGAGAKQVPAKVDTKARKHIVQHSDSDGSNFSDDDEEKDEDGGGSKKNMKSTDGKKHPGSKATTKMSIKAGTKGKRKRSSQATATHSMDSSEHELSDWDSDVEAAIAAAAVSARKAERASGGKPKSVMHLISWFRIVLDEAHMIKDRSTSTAKAVFNLESVHKWCLTGTPLQNRVGELYSLVRFLRLDPHAYYYCKGKDCDCKSLHYKFSRGLCELCGHSAMQHFCHFNKHILNPIQRSGYVDEGRRAMLELKDQVLDKILLRRTKTSRADDIQLPPRIVRVRADNLDEKEDDFYQALYTQSQAQFNTYVVQGTVLNNYAHIFDILMRLRQAVDHPYLVIHSSTKREGDGFLDSQALVGSVGKGDDGSSHRHPRVDDDDHLECSICQDPPEDLIQAECGHMFCRACVVEYIETVVPSKSDSAANLVSTGMEVDDGKGSNYRGKKKTSDAKSRGDERADIAACPVCREPLTIDLESGDSEPSYMRSFATSSGVAGGHRKRKTILDKIDLSLFQSSTKLEALMEEVTKMEVEEAGAKAIVFSQFVNMLDLIDYRLDRGGVKAVKLLGSMTLDQRDQVITRFKGSPTAVASTLPVLCAFMHI